jgi:acyl-CoA reductase-like NAD-dependent aldehyde dehydrogenase
VAPDTWEDSLADYHRLTSPVDGRVLGQWGDGATDLVEQAYIHARGAASELGELGTAARCELLDETAPHLTKLADDAMVPQLVLEHGKTVAEYRAELRSAAHGLSEAADYARKLEPELFAMATPGTHAEVERVGLGVVAAITPWNFPVNIPIEYAAPALAMGNSVLWKPAESTPLASALLANAFASVGWPEASFQVLWGGPNTGRRLAQGDVNALCFNGSSEVGHQLSNVGGMRKLVLELGVNGPTIVLDDADVQDAARSAVQGAVFCSGQSCAATERVFVDAGIVDEFVEAAAEEAGRLLVGDPFDGASTFGPLHLAQTAEKMSRHVDDALTLGAVLVRGGAPLPDAPTDRYWPVTVLAGVDPSSAVIREETFGPIVPIAAFASEGELRFLVDQGRYGLSAAVFSGDEMRARRLAVRLPAGTVVVNANSNTWETHVPFGGYPGRSSGLGRVGTPASLLELSTTRTITVHRRGGGQPAG